jgi:hypothetical protein
VSRLIELIEAGSPGDGTGQARDPA